MKMTPSSKVRVKPHVAEPELYEQLLTELAEVFYDLLGPRVKSNSIVTGKPQNEGVESG